MSDRLVVSTRKGLFTIERSGGAWRVAGADFLGDNVTLFFHDQRSGHDYAALNHGHFGAKLHRRTNGRWEEIAAPAYPPKPEGLIDRDGWGKDIPYSLINIFALDWRPGRGGSSVVWDHSGRALPLARPRLELGADSLPVGRSQAPTMDGRRHGVAGDPFHLGRSARLPGRADRRLVRRRVGDARRRRDLGLPRRRHVRRLPAPRYGPRPERAGPPLSGPEPKLARPALAPAP